MYRRFHQTSVGRAGSNKVCLRRRCSFREDYRQSKCTMMQSNKGTEFLNASFQSMLRRHGKHVYTSEKEDLKAAIVERFNRTLKDKMFRYFTHQNRRRYVDVLNDMLYSYKNSYRRSIAMAPSEVNEDNGDVVRASLYPSKPTKPKTFKWK